MFGKNKKFGKVVEVQPEEMEDIEEVEEQPRRVVQQRPVPIAPRAPQQGGYKPLAEKKFEVGEIKIYPVEVQYTVTDENGEEIPFKDIGSAKIYSAILKA